MNEQKQAFTEQQTFTFLDRIYAAKQALPTYQECKARGYRGGTRMFAARREVWARCHGLETRVPREDRAKYLPNSLAAATEIVRRTSKMPPLESERGTKGRPLVRPCDPATPTQQAVRLYRAAWKQIREKCS